MEQFTRRYFLKVFGGASAALFVLPQVGCSSKKEEKPNCNDTTGVDTTLRQQLKYVPKSQDPQKRCELCQFYTPMPNGCGSCQLFPGPVDPQGSCMSFAPKQPS